MPRNKLTHVKVTIHVRNRKSIKALMHICRILQELHNDMPWHTEVKSAVRAAQYVIDHLKVQAH